MIYPRHPIEIINKTFVLSMILWGILCPAPAISVSGYSLIGQTFSENGGKHWKLTLNILYKLYIIYTNTLSNLNPNPNPYKQLY